MANFLKIRRTLRRKWNIDFLFILPCKITPLLKFFGTTRQNCNISSFYALLSQKIALFKNFSAQSAEIFFQPGKSGKIFWKKQWFWVPNGDTIFDTVSKDALYKIVWYKEKFLCTKIFFKSLYTHKVARTKK